MPYIVTQCWFPAIKADETTQKYLELMEKYPFDESVGKQIIPSAVTVNKNGYETFSVVEAEVSQAGEAIEWAKRFMVEFCTIEGFNYEIKAWSTAAEGLARMGVV